MNKVSFVRKRILMLNSTRGFVGGVERLMVRLSLDLQAQGHQIFGLFEHFEREDPGFEKAFSESRCASEDEIESLIPYYQAQNIDIVFIHKCNHARWIDGFNRSFHTVVLVHDHDYYCIRRHKYFPYKRRNCPLPFSVVSCSICSMLVQKRGKSIQFINPIRRMRLLQAIRDCNMIFVLSDFMRHNLLANGFAENRIKLLIPHQEPVVLCDSIDKKVPLILFVGQLIRGKGVDLLIRASAKLQNPGLLRIVGRGKDREFLQKLCQTLGLHNKIEFVDWTDDVSAHYKEADIVVVPSRWQEPFGLIGIEAFAHARPVVAYDSGGIRQWLRHKQNGLLVRSGSIDKLTEAIDALLSSKELRDQYGKAAYDTICSYYNRDTYLNSLLEPLGIL